MNKSKPKCIDPRVLSAFVDNQIGPKKRGGVVQHLGLCPHCRGVEDELRAVKTKLAASCAPEPNRNLWPGIENRIRGKSRSSETFAPLWRLWIPVPLAAVLAGVAVTLWLWWPEPGSRTNRSQPHSPSQEIARAVATVQQAESTYREAIEALMQVLEQEKHTLDPQTARIVETSLADIDRAIERCRTAMRQNPKNLQVQRAMLFAYQEKMDFLFQLVGPRVRAQGT